MPNSTLVAKNKLDETPKEEISELSATHVEAFNNSRLSNLKAEKTQTLNKSRHIVDRYRKNIIQSQRKNTNASVQLLNSSIATDNRSRITKIGNEK